jgi:hypothetical protein
MFHYEFDNLKNHGMVSIYKGDEFIDYYFIGECLEDFDIDEIKKIKFMVNRSVNSFIANNKNKIVSDCVLSKLGLLNQEQSRDISY